MQHHAAAASATTTAWHARPSDSPQPSPRCCKYHPTLETTPSAIRTTAPPAPHDCCNSWVQHTTYRPRPPAAAAATDQSCCCCRRCQTHAMCAFVLATVLHPAHKGNCHRSQLGGRSWQHHTALFVAELHANSSCMHWMCRTVTPWIPYL